MLLAIDIGTSACKIAIFYSDGRIAAESSKSYQTYYPAPGWVEQDPNEWWDEICVGIRECLEKGGIKPSKIAAVGIDGQSWSCIPIDREGNVLCRTPIWMDTRSLDVCEQANREIGAGRIFQLSGNPLQPFYTTPKILWFKKHRADLYEDAFQFLQSNSFIGYRLTGVISQDFSQSYSLHVFDIEKRRYSDDMCKALGIDRDKLPEICDCHQVIGTVTKEAAARTGLCEGIPVIAGGLDAACGALGAGVRCPGQTQEQGGQAGGMSICLDRPVKNDALILGLHVVPGLWLLQGGSVGGGGCLRWLARELGSPEELAAEETGKSQFELLDELAAAVPAGSDGVIFLPYLEGERSPIWDPDAKGVFFGLGYDKTRAHFFRSLLEGVAYALEHNLETAEASGVHVDELWSVGGAANSRLWMQIKADVTGKRIVVPESDHATTLGAAILGGMGVGVYSSFEEAVSKTIHHRRSFEPDPERHEKYMKYYEIYLEIYRQLKSTMKKVVQITRSETEVS